MSEQSVIGVYNTMTEAEAAVRLLDRGGFPIKQVSIVAQDMQGEKEVHGFLTTGDVAKAGASTAVWVGGLFGLLAGAAFIWVPGFGPLIAAGPFSAMLLSGMEGVMAGEAGGGLLGVLIGWSVSKQHILEYEEHLRSGKYLLMAHGSAEEVTRVRNILHSTGAVEVTHHVEAAT